MIRCLSFGCHSVEFATKNANSPKIVDKTTKIW